MKAKATMNILGYIVKDKLYDVTKYDEFRIYIIGENGQEVFDLVSAGSLILQEDNYDNDPFEYKPSHTFNVNTNKECQHNFVDYIGMIQTFRYCTKCDKKG